MKRWLPSPWLSASLWAMWLLLNDSLAPAHLLLGFLAAVLIPLLVLPLRPPGPPLRRPLAIPRLVLHVGIDVVEAAVLVAWGVFRSRRRPPRGAFVAVPLELQDPHGLASLAIITAVTPGTVWSELAADRKTLLIHVFDLADEAAFIAHYKSRYERPLREIFE
jgi:multicomponent K+:H+ antiporter subunit E